MCHLSARAHLYLARLIDTPGNVTASDQHLGQRRPSERAKQAYMESPIGEAHRSAHGTETFVNESFWLGESAPWKQGPCVDAHGRTSISRMNQRGAASASQSHYDPQHQPLRLTIRCARPANKENKEICARVLSFSPSGSSIFLWTWQGTISVREGDGDSELQMEKDAGVFLCSSASIAILFLKRRANGFFWALYLGWEAVSEYVDEKMHEEMTIK